VDAGGHPAGIGGEWEQGIRYDYPVFEKMQCLSDKKIAVMTDALLWPMAHLGNKTG
jgi:hypothetical protein